MQALPENEKERIRLEETYRLEVRKELERNDKPSKRGKLLEFFNSNLGLFVLSSVFVSFFSWGYSQYADAKKHEEESRNALQKLKIEIPYRLEYLNSATYVTFYGQNAFEVRNALVGAEGKLVFPEFEKRSLYSLLYEYVSIINNLDGHSRRSKKRGNETMDNFKKASYYYDAMNTTRRDTTITTGARVRHEEYYHMPYRFIIPFRARMSAVYEYLKDTNDL